MSSLGGGKMKPEDLFESLRVIKQEHQSQPEASDVNFAQKFFDRFSNRFSEGNPYEDAANKS